LANVKTVEMSKICMLTSLIVITGMIKIPSPIPGAEFQLSAPIAVAIAVVFGFWRYIIAGILASFIMFLTGLNTIINIEIAMIFRIVAGGIVALFGNCIPVIVLAGPLGSAAARLILSYTLHINFWPLLIGAIPGMIFTMIFVLPLIKVLERVNKGVYHKYER